MAASDPRHSATGANRGDIPTARFFCWNLPFVHMANDHSRTTQQSIANARLIPDQRRLGGVIFQLSADAARRDP